ncbi:MAG TPA: alkaline phosphatase D family protein, partial [Cytophagaceae bacterium]
SQIQPILASSYNYAIWDDHDFGPNDAAGNHPTKKLSRELFKLYWANPTTGINESGVNTLFKWSDVQFFLMDDRYWRAPSVHLFGEKPFLGKSQFKWLIDSLKSSTANFKIIAVGTQVLNSVLYKENYSNYARERNKLLRIISKNNIEGVVFVSGDRHHTELIKKDFGTPYTLYDLTVSPLTSGVHKFVEHNELRVANSLVLEKNFGMLEFSGPPESRVMTIRIYNNKGIELWHKEIYAKDLKKSQ